MRSSAIILWAVDTQRDFMIPGGKLYVPGAEKLLPRIQKLTDAARCGQAFLVSHGCFHSADDPEFKLFPSHCVEGTPGAEFVPECLTERVRRIANHPSHELPSDFSDLQQILLEKQTLDIFQSHHAHSLVDRLGNEPEFVVFGVVTEYCVQFAVKGLLHRKRRVTVVEDAIESLKPEDGSRSIAELRSLGAQLTTTSQVLARLQRLA